MFFVFFVYFVSSLEVYLLRVSVSHDAAKNKRACGKSHTPFEIDERRYCRVAGRAAPCGSANAMYSPV